MLLNQCATLVGNEIRFTYNSHNEAHKALNAARTERELLCKVAEDAKYCSENEGGGAIARKRLAESITALAEFRKGQQ